MDLTLTARPAVAERPGTEPRRTVSGLEGRAPEHAGPACLGSGRRLSYDARQLISDGDTADKRVYRVVEGAAQAFTLRADGRRVVFHFLYPGDIFWPRAVSAERQALETLTRTLVTAAAETDLSETDEPEDVASVSAVTDWPDHQRPMLARPTADGWPDHWAFRLMQQEVARATDHRTLLSLRSGTERVAAFLLALVERARARGGDGMQLWLPMTREDIADHLGLTTETVCRIFARMQRAGLLRSHSRSKVEIFDVEGLDRLAQGELL